MRRTFIQLIGRTLAVTAGFMALPVFAHEKWYADEAILHTSKPVIFSEVTVFGLVITGLTFAVLVVLYLLDRKYEKAVWLRKFDKTFGSMRLEAKTILAALLGASLMGAGLQQTYFIPNLVLPETTFGFLVATASILLGIMFMFLVRFTPELGILLGAFYLVGFTLFPATAMLEELLFLAIAIYFVTQEAHRLPWKKWNTPEMRRKGYHAFRMVLGFAFVVLSFVKWLRPDLAITLIDQYGINFVQGLGFDSSHFTFFAACTELFIGLAIMGRVFLRPIAILGIFVFSASIFVFGFPELLGHLPIKGALFLLFIHGPYLENEKS